MTIVFNAIARSASLVVMAALRTLFLANMALLAGAALDHASAQAGPQGGGTVPNNGEDFTRPETLFQLRYLFRTAPGNGSLPGTIRTVTTDFLILRSDLKIDLAPQWTLALRGDLPFSAKNPITSNDPTGDYLYGLGDGDVQAALIRTVNTRWATGGGLRIVAPTGAEGITGGTWQALPIIGARYMLPELGQGSFFTALVRYDVSFAGATAAKNISNLQFAPTLNINLPGRWFVTFYPSPDIRINYGDPAAGQTGRLFLPFDFLVGCNLTKDITLSVEASVPMVNEYPVYNFKTVTRFNLKF